MSETIAHYSFLPWLRQGLSAKIAEDDTLGGVDGAAVERAALKIDLIVRDTGKADGATHDHTITKNVQLIGPGDVQGIDPRAIIRTFPARGIPNFETNLLPYIEFYEEDFPWRFTPAGAAGPGERRLRPWLALVVLKEEEFTLTTPIKGLAILNIKKEVIDLALPPHTETWAWAHVQINQPLNQPSDVRGVLAANPDNGISRLLSPRKLVKDTPYRAFLIPAFETGRLAGLGLDPAGVPAQAPSWKKGQMAATTKPRGQDFPVYYHWHFQTSSGGDFETLVSILKPIVVKPEMGTLAMDIHSPGFGLDSVAGSATVGFEGALKPPTFQAADFPATSAAGENPSDRDFVDRLREVLNLSADLTQAENGVNKASEVFNPFYEGSSVDDPIVAPPTYGYWHALLQRLGETGNPAWIETLNLDPRRRGAGGIGTQSVRDNQEDLMNRAWQQVEQINDANRKIREGVLAKQVASFVYLKHVRALPDDKFLSLTASMQGLAKRNAALKTARFEIRDSRIPLAAQSAAFRKLTRPQGSLNSVLNKTAETPAVLRENILKNFNIGGETNAVGVAAAVLKTGPESALPAADIITFVQSASVQLTSEAELVARQTMMRLLDQANLNPSVSNIKTQLTNLLAQEPGLSNEARTLSSNFINGLTARTKEDGMQTLSVSKGSYEALFGEGANNKHGEKFTVKRAGEATTLRPVSSITTAGDAQVFLQGMQALEANVSAFQAPAVRPQLVTGLSGMRQELQAKFNPGYTLDIKVRSRIRLWIDGELRPLPELKPVMKYPVFPEPVYVHARKLSQDYILPNVAKLAKNSVTLMLSNQAFIESFMAGMNHEMSRELLWREFPTDQRGSYFRQFWDASDNILETNAEKKLDIRQMHRWQGALGSHATRSGENLVLVVRGDLFIKYPDTIVYAQKAIYDPSNPAKPRQLQEPATEANVRFPIFSAELEPDIFLFGFALGVAEARGERIRDPAASPAGKNPGWFFAFKERPGQIKFGLDDYADPIGGTTMPAGKPATWPDLTWEHLVSAPAELQAYLLNFSRAITITSPPAGQPNPAWASNAADMASILYQNPVIFARHADEMLEG